MYVPQEAPNDMLQQSRCLLFHKLANHVAKDRAHSIEPLISGTYVVQSVVIKQDLLDDEDGNGLAQLRAGLHNSKTEGDDLGRQEEVDDFGGVVLDQGANDTETGEPKILERTRLGGRVEKRVEIERYMRWGVLVLVRLLAKRGHCHACVPLRNNVRVSL